MASICRSGAVLQQRRSTVLADKVSTLFALQAGRPLFACRRGAAAVHRRPRLVRSRPDGVAAWTGLHSPSTRAAEAVYLPTGGRGQAVLWPVDSLCTARRQPLRGPPQTAAGRCRWRSRRRSWRRAWRRRRGRRRSAAAAPAAQHSAACPSATSARRLCRRRPTARSAREVRPSLLQRRDTITKPTSCGPLDRSSGEVGEEVEQPLPIGNPPRPPNKLIVSGAVHGQMSGRSRAVVCRWWGPPIHLRGSLATKGFSRSGLLLLRIPMRGGVAPVKCWKRKVLANHPRFPTI